MNLNKRLGACIKKIREEKLIKQALLAKELKISVQTLSAIENGKSKVTVVKLDQIATQLDIDVIELIALTKVESINQ